MLELIAYNMIEMVMTTGLTHQECVRLEQMLERNEIYVAFNSTGRVLTFECDEVEEGMKEITAAMADMGLVEDIGLIKWITTFEPQWTEEMHVTVQ